MLERRFLTVQLTTMMSSIYQKHLLNRNVLSTASMRPLNVAGKLPDQRKELLTKKKPFILGKSCFLLTALTNVLLGESLCKI